MNNQPSNYQFSRMSGVQSPVIPLVGELIKNNPGTISLGQGVVHYSPPKEVRDFLEQFFQDPANNSYQSVLGIPKLLFALTQKLADFNGIIINDHQSSVVVTAGSNMGFMNAVLAITNPGDEIILNVPYYFNHEMAITMAGCLPVMVETDENYQLIPEKIAAAITDKTRAIVTVSPNNPTGAVYSEIALHEVNQICQERHIYHISDEAYEYFTYNGVKHISPGAFPNSSQYTISLYSFSKSYGFASWRVGYMVIPQHLLSSVKKVQDTILICPPVLSQYAALGALHANGEFLKINLQSVSQTRKIVMEALHQLPSSCTIAPGEGAFYFLLKVNTPLNAFELVKKLIEEHKIAVLPGTTFGIHQGCCLRVAYGVLKPETAAPAIERLVTGLQVILG